MMSSSPIFLVLLVTFCASALEQHLNDGILEVLGRLETQIGKLETEVKDLRHLKQRLGKVDALENEVKQLQWQLKQQKVDRSRRGLLIPPVWTSCPNGTFQNGDSCYMVSKEVANWPNALVYCEAYGGNLAVIDSASEQQFIVSQLSKFHYTDPAHYLWIGGLDALNTNEWFWSKSMTPLKYNNWGPGEPDNVAAHHSHTQDCLAMWQSGRWDDGWCETEHNFLCEIKLNEDNILVG